MAAIVKDIFISYGREEGVREFVKQLKADLEANGVSVWLDADDIPTGSDFHVEIGVALKSCRALIPVLTKKYVQSRYCKGELYVANGEKKILLPVVYEDGWDEGNHGAGVKYIVAAFNWAFFRPNQDDYQESLNRLINGAKLNLKMDVQPVIPTNGTHVSGHGLHGQSKKYCSLHPSKELDLYCETCEELICLHCTVKVHKDHQYDLVGDSFQRHKAEITASLEPVEKQLGVVKIAREELDVRSLELDDLQATLEINVQQQIRQLQGLLETRKAELIGQIQQTVQVKKKNLAAQKDEVDTLQTKLEGCMSFVRESLRTRSQREVMKMKKDVVTQIDEVTGNFKPDSLSPCESANIKFTASTRIATSMCQQFGDVYLQVSPEKCYTTGNGLEVVKYGEIATVKVNVVDETGKACPAPVEALTSELISEVCSKRIDCSVKKTEIIGQYEVSYQATNRGRHQLHIIMEGKHIKGSPFPVTVKLPIEKLGTPIRTINEVKKPSCVAIDSVGNIIVTEASEHCISIFSPAGEKIKSFGFRGSSPGQFNTPKGIALDSDDSILVADNHNDRIQKFTSTSSGTTFVAAVNSSSFRRPVGIAVHPETQKVYVADSHNHCVQILNPDLTFSCSFGSRGSGTIGQFQFPYDVAFDSCGNVYVVDGGNHCIQVFTADGHSLRKFGRKGKGYIMELDWPNTISIDSEDVVYVVDQNNNRVSVFTCEGKFLTAFGTKGGGPGQFNYPYGVAVDRSGLVYVSDNTGRIQIF